MIEINTWMNEFLSAINKAFGDRVWFVGLQGSYPSSTTLLVMCVMPTAIMQLGRRIRNKTLRNIVVVSIVAFIAFMVIGRLISGVHWFTDIVGGALLSAGLVMLYYPAAIYPFSRVCAKKML